MLQTQRLNLFGRRKILCDEPVINESNIVEVLRDALKVHEQNRVEIDYLYRYYKGEHPVLNRTKEIRPEICNKVPENRAFEFVEFKTGYMLDGPIKYISRSKDEKITLEIGKLNDMMAMCDKESLDSDLFEWMYICGTGYRMVMSNSPYITNTIIPRLFRRKTKFSEDEAPFSLYVLDPRNSFVVYYSGLDEVPLMGVKYVVQGDNKTIYSAYTPTHYFELESDSFLSNDLKLVKDQERALGFVPIVEYPLNNARIGIVEIVASIMDAIDEVQSSRIDGIAQFVQSLWVLYNAEIDENTAKNLRQAGLITLKSFGDNKADIKNVVEELNQQETQVLVDYMYQTMLNIVGMPNRNGGKSTSDTGAATLVRDGWETTERRAKKDEKKFKSAERQFLKIVLRIMRDTVGTPLKLFDIDIKFPARSYKNKVAMAQMLTTMLNCEKIHPLLAFTECELFDDPQAAYQMSDEHYQKVKKEMEEQLKNTPPNEPQNKTPKAGGVVA